MGYAMRKKLTALLLACLLLVCLVLPVSAADAPALYGTANAADGTVQSHSVFAAAAPCAAEPSRSATTAR